MSLSDGGHLTHGSPVNFSGKFFNAFQYGVVARTGQLDYAEVQALADEHKPGLIIAGFSAHSRILDWQRFRDIADSCGAYLMVDMAHVAGLVATGHYPNPLPFADVVTSTTHKTLRGPRGGIILARENEELAKKFNSLVFPGTQGGPLMHVIAGVPSRSPLATNGERGSFGTVFLLTVILACPSAASASLPVMSLSIRLNNIK